MRSEPEGEKGDFNILTDFPSTILYSVHIDHAKIKSFASHARRLKAHQNEFISSFCVHIVRARTAHTDHVTLTSVFLGFTA